MATIKVHAGDFTKGEGQVAFGHLTLKTKEKYIMGEGIAFSELDDVAVATEDSVKKIGGTVGWGIVGGVILGPVGLLAGLLLGGKKKEVTFVARFKDGRKLLATADSKTFIKLQSATF